MRKGYKAELKAKKELEAEYGKGNVIKVAIGGACDYIVASCGEIIKIVEVKEVHNKKKYYPTKREKLQIQRIEELAKKHKIRAELWIYYFLGKGTHTIKIARRIW